MAGYRCSENTNKDRTLTIRCTEDEKSRIIKEAFRRNQSASTYILDCSMAGLERKSHKEKQRLVHTVMIMEKANEIKRGLEKNTAPNIEGLKIQIDELMGEVEKLWVC